MKCDLFDGGKPQDLTPGVPLMAQLRAVLDTVCTQVCNAVEAGEQQVMCVDITGQHARTGEPKLIRLVVSTDDGISAKLADALPKE